MGGGGSRAATWFVSFALALSAACTTEKLALGAGCGRNSECDTPLVCRIERCRNECNTTRDCAAGLDCVLDEAGLGACQLPEDRSCALDSDCGKPLKCREQQCVNECAEDRDCPAGARCSPSNACIDAHGRACTSHGECEPAGLVCATDGRCRQECLTDRDCRFGTSCMATMVCSDSSGPRDAGRPMDSAAPSGDASVEAGVHDSGDTDAP